MDASVVAIERSRSLWTSLGHPVSRPLGFCFAGARRERDL
jgi:hypothetical protein